MSFQVREIGPADARIDFKAVKGIPALVKIAGVQATILGRIHAKSVARASAPPIHFENWMMPMPSVSACWRLPWPIAIWSAAIGSCSSASGRSWRRVKRGHEVGGAAGILVIRRQCGPPELHRSQKRWP